jgi:hypothetical protein
MWRQIRGKQHASRKTDWVHGQPGFAAPALDVLLRNAADQTQWLGEWRESIQEFSGEITAT